MNVYFTIQASHEVLGKIGIINRYDEQIANFFRDKSYSNDLEHLFIGLFCMSPNFEPFFAPYKPKYTAETKTVVNVGIEVLKNAKSYEYEVRLEYSRYSGSGEIESQLANDIINSLDSIQTCKKIRKLDLLRFKEDCIKLFQSIGWL